MNKDEFVRDGRSPIPESVKTSRQMSQIKAKNTKPELLVRKALFRIGIRGYRLHWKKVPGRPDMAFPGKKVAIFINGCFWHQCPKCQQKIPKVHTDFWKEKFQKNTERDKNKIEALEKLGWKVSVLWECEIKKELEACASKILKLIR